MKIKEKGLSGKAADLRRQSMAGTGRKGFNAFKEMASQKGDKGKKKAGGRDEGKRQVMLEFLGQKIPVSEEDGGSIKEDDLTFVKGASLKFEGVEGDVSFDEIKVRSTHSRRSSRHADTKSVTTFQAPLKERFPRAPFVQYNKGDTWGLVGFDKALNEDEITYVKEHIKTLGSKEVTWSIPEGKRRRLMSVISAPTEY